MPDEPLVALDRVSKTYSGRRGFLHFQPSVPALFDIDLNIEAGSRLAIAGASGSGKTTLGRCIVLRERPTAGAIRFKGRDVPAFNRRELRQYLRALQLIPQDPAACLNPWFPAWRIVSEPRLIARQGNRQQFRRGALELMSMVGLPERSADSRAREFSGGQRVRLALARALAADPQLLILDESLAGLDLSIQAQIVNLLLDLQSRLGLAYILISHDLAMAAHFADRIVVLDRGRIVEQGSPRELFRHPAHTSTQALVAAAPVLTRAATG